jgi:hypothetical protein
VNGKDGYRLVGRKVEGEKEEDEEVRRNEEVSQ